MAFYAVDDFVREADRQIAGYQEQLSRFETLARDTLAKRRDLEERLVGAYADLGAALLPELTATAFEELANRLGLPELRSIYQKAANRQAAIDQRLNQIESSDIYKNREQRVYDLEKQLDEVRPPYEHARVAWESLNRFPHLPGLLSRQYGTPNYPHRGWLRFFNGQFLADWRHADEIVQALGMASFPEVADAYRERQEQVDVLGRSVRELQDGLKDIQTTVQERTNLLAERDNLPRLVQEQTGRTVAPLLDKIDVSSLPHADTLRGRGLVLDGMEHQVQYLDDLRAKIVQDTNQLRDRADKLISERQRYASDRYRYRNKRFTQDQFDKRFDRRRIERYDVLYNRYNRAGTTIYVFDDYYRVSPLEEFLWWDIMTDGRIDGNFIPEVQDYYAVHPDYAYQRPDFYDRPDDDSSGFAASGFADNS